jgi:hypothetical protein
MGYSHGFGTEKYMENAKYLSEIVKKIKEGIKTFQN